MIWVGTSGYNYPEWRGSFYPEKLAAAKMLPYYAARFPTVEINYTFYRAPNEKILAGWSAATPDRFKLTLKAPRRITHESWLDEEIYARLRARNLSLCIADSERLSTPVVITADYAYFRLRDEGYTPDDIARLADAIREKT